MAQTAQLRHIDATGNEAQRVFALQRAAYKRHPYPSYEERLDKLNKSYQVGGRPLHVRRHRCHHHRANA